MWSPTPLLCHLLTTVAFPVFRVCTAAFHAAGGHIIGDRKHA